jgi:hypothetical protein
LGSLLGSVNGFVELFWDEYLNFGIKHWFGWLKTFESRGSMELLKSWARESDGGGIRFPWEILSNDH